MSDLTLFFAPDTCARVSMIALEETERPYKTELIAFMRGDHRSPRCLALNPKGRVPTLIVDGRVLTENVAILLWLGIGAAPAGALIEIPNVPGRRICSATSRAPGRRRAVPGSRRASRLHGHFWEFYVDRRSVATVGLCGRDGRQPRPTRPFRRMREPVSWPEHRCICRAPIPVSAELGRSGPSRRARLFTGWLLGTVRGRSHSDRTSFRPQIPRSDRDDLPRRSLFFCIPEVIGFHRYVWK
jgi:hypothetical protein